MLIKFDAPKTGKWALYFDGCIVNDGVRIVDMRNDDNNMAYVCTRRVSRWGVRKTVEECDSTFIEGLTRRDDYEQILQKMMDHAIVIAVYYKNNLAGYASMYANDLKTRQAYISMFGIKKEYQRKHLGSILMDKCCEIANQSGMRWILLEVLKENVKGFKFYKKYGYIPTGKESEYSVYMKYGGLSNTTGELKS